MKDHEDTIEDKIREFMEMAKSGAHEVLNAGLWSDDFCLTQATVTMAILAGHTSAHILQSYMGMLLKSLEDHVAPKWAAEQCGNRLHENQEEWEKKINEKGETLGLDGPPWSGATLLSGGK